VAGKGQAVVVWEEEVTWRVAPAEEPLLPTWMILDFRKALPPDDGIGRRLITEAAAAA